MKQTTRMAMNAFRKHSKDQVVFSPSEPKEVRYVVQENMMDCGMVVAGFALALALRLDIGCVPSKFSAQLRHKWCSAISKGL